MQYIRYRHFVNAFMTEEEAKAEASEIEVDIINDKGAPAKRPGLLNDFLPSPYPNRKAAEAANNGAEPPDLSLMGWAREDGDNYIFHLLTGFLIFIIKIKVYENLVMVSMCLRECFVRREKLIIHTSQMEVS